MIFNKKKKHTTPVVGFLLPFISAASGEFCAVTIGVLFVHYCPSFPSVYSFIEISVSVFF